MTYTNTTYAYSIRYPGNKGWVHEENGAGVGFGTPLSKSGGYIWGTAAYDKNTVGLSTLLARMGSQFSDRKESRENITINGVPALLVTVTTNQADDWISKMVYIERNGRIYTISNGAIDSPDFVTFYNSFHFTN